MGETGSEQIQALSVLGPVSRPGRRRRIGEETLPVAWRPFQVLKPILQALGWGALRGVLLSRCIPWGCVAHHPPGGGGRKGERKVMQDAPGWMEGEDLGKGR